MNLDEEREQVSHAVETNSLIAKLLANQDRENKGLWIAQIFSWAVIACLIFCMAYQQTTMQETIQEAISESQEAINEAVREALNTVADMEVSSDTVTTTLEGDSAVYNDVEGDQFNDSAQKNGGEG